MRTTNPQYPLTAKSEAYVITNAGETVCWFDSTRAAACYASGYAGRFAMFVVTNTPPDGNGNHMVGFDCSF